MILEIKPESKYWLSIPDHLIAMTVLGKDILRLYWPQGEGDVFTLEFLSYTLFSKKPVHHLITYPKMHIEEIVEDTPPALKSGQ